MHRQRLEGRRRDIPSFIYEPTWEKVVERIAQYEPCTDEDRLVIDAVSPLEENVRRATEFVLKT